MRCDVGVGKDYRDIVAWQRAIDFAEHVYHFTSQWPREERYSLTDQLRRAAVAIAANIAEGQGRNSTKEFVHFLGIAHGSLREAETYLLLALRLKYYDEATYNKMMPEATEIGKPLRGLIRSMRQ